MQTDNAEPSSGFPHDAKKKQHANYRGAVGTERGVGSSQRTRNGATFFFVA
jgi:hypothetical protein